MKKIGFALAILAMLVFAGTAFAVEGTEGTLVGKNVEGSLTVTAVVEKYASCEVGESPDVLEVPDLSGAANESKVGHIKVVIESNCDIHILAKGTQLTGTTYGDTLKTEYRVWEDLRDWVEANSDATIMDDAAPYNSGTGIDGTYGDSTYPQPEDNPGVWGTFLECRATTGAISNQQADDYSAEVTATISAIQ